MTSIPSRRPPPPPPRRRSPLVSKDPDVFWREASSGTDSGISESSSVSSLPLVTSSSPQEHCLESDMSDSGLGPADVEPLHSVSVLSLPSCSSASREVKSESELLSTSLVVNNKSLRRPPAPPVRTDSIRSTRKIIRTPKLKLSFEDKFSFRSCEYLPQPLPLSAEKKSYPSKELFSWSPSPTKEREEEEPLPESLKRKEKKSQRLSLDPAGLWSRMGFGGARTPSWSPRLKSRSSSKCCEGHDSCKDLRTSSVTGGDKENYFPPGQTRKPPIAKKPVLDRTVSSVVLSPSHGRGMCRSLSAASPSRPKRESVSRPAPPPPTRR